MNVNRKTITLKSEELTYLTVTENSFPPKKNPNKNEHSTEPENAELFHFTDTRLTGAFEIVESVSNSLPCEFPGIFKWESKCKRKDCRIITLHNTQSS